MYDVKHLLSVQNAGYVYETKVILNKQDEY